MICRSDGSRDLHLPFPLRRHSVGWVERSETHRPRPSAHGSRNDGFRCALPILRAGGPTYLRLTSAHSVLLIPNSLMNPSASSTPQSADCASVAPLALRLFGEDTGTASTRPRAGEPRVGKRSVRRLYY